MIDNAMVDADQQQGQQYAVLASLKLPGAIVMCQPDTRILVVDDFLSYRQSLTALIAVLDGIHAVGVASDGVQALALCEILQPEVVLMDIEMPVLDGVECTRVIKFRWPHIQVIGLFGFDESSRIKEMIDAGAWRCLSKTTLADDLHRFITMAAKQKPDGNVDE